MDSPLLLLTQGTAGDRLGALLAPALQSGLPHRPLLGLGGPRMEAAGVTILARTDSVSAMGYTGLLPEVPSILRLMLQASRRTKQAGVGCVVAIDTWQPLRFLHRFAPHLEPLPHVCYLPPGPNLIGASRVHPAAARRFRRILTPFRHQLRLYAEAGGAVRPAGHAGLAACLEEHPPLPAGSRTSEIAILPGSRTLEVRHGLPVMLEAVRLLRQKRPDLEPVVCCASPEIERMVRTSHPELRTEQGSHAVLARAGFGLICSGTAALEAAVLGCPGVVTYHGSALQRWEWKTFHVEKLERLRAAGIASPFVALPNIVTGEEVYPELLDAPPEEIARSALERLRQSPTGLRQKLAEVSHGLEWAAAGPALCRAIEEALSTE